MPTPSAPSPSTQPGEPQPSSPWHKPPTKPASFPPARSTPTASPCCPTPSKTPAATMPTSSPTYEDRGRTSEDVGRSICCWARSNYRLRGVRASRRPLSCPEGLNVAAPIVVEGVLLVIRHPARGQFRAIVELQVREARRVW